MAQQFGKHTTHQALGLKLSDDQLNNLRGDQIGQLFELFQEIQNPSSTREDGTRSDEGGTKSPLANEAGSSSQTDEGGTKSQTSPLVNS